MQVEQGTHCPLLNKKCIGLKCAWFIQLRGKHPQTGSDVDEWACSVAWLPMLLIEQAKETRQTGAEVSALRSESLQAAKATVSLLAAQKQPRLIEGDK